MKILILGHGRHGKGTLAQIFKDKYGLSAISSSMAAAAAIRPYLRTKYPTFEDFYADRVNHREEWRELISDYNKHDRGRLCKQILDAYDIYDGMRCDLEYQATKHLFDLVIWVERDGAPLDSSLTITYNNGEMLYIDNSGSIKFLEHTVESMLYFLGGIQARRLNNAD